MGKKKDWSDEMNEDIYYLSNKEFAKKHGVSTSVPDEMKKKLGILAYDQQKKNNEKKTPFPEESIDDLGKMSDGDFSEKWGIEKYTVRRERDRRDISPYMGQTVRIEHQISDGVEYKWCGCGHWENVCNFAKTERNWDGLYGYCKTHHYEKSKRFRDSNDGKEYYSEYHKEWSRNNPEKVKSYEQRRIESGKSREYQRIYRNRPENKIKGKIKDSIRRERFIHWTIDDTNWILSKFEYLCPYCFVEYNDKFEFDHFISISQGGYTIPGNCLMCCRECNRGINGKFDNHPLDWLKNKFEDGGMVYNMILKILEEHRNIYIGNGGVVSND